ncbi:MAG TPA: DUF2961 domain-containing protein [Abditibacteriaceae bacterium]|jgi:hypothetical protein
MARFIKGGRMKVEVGKLHALLFFGIVLLFSPSYAADESLSYSPDWPVYKWFASTDPKNENEDYLLLKPGEKRRIPLTAGVLNRLWFTALEPEKIDVSLFFPGKPAHNLTRGGQVVNKSWASSRALIYEKAFTSYHSPVFSVGGKPLPWQTLPQGAALEVFNKSQNPEGNKFFYQASIRPLFKALSLETGTRQNLQQKIELAPGDEQTLELSGAGLIEGITLSPLRVADLQVLQLKIAFDSKETAVESPLSALLGLFDKGQSTQSAAFVLDEGKAAISWPMPFGKGVRLTFINNGAKPLALDTQIAYRQLNQAPPYRFHAAYGSARTQEKKPLRMLNIKGKGALCGMNLSITPAPDSGRRTFAYLEGNETITADGKVFEGTGTEDYFSSAWYFPEKPFTADYHGMTSKAKMPPSISAYRLMIPDALPFKQSLQFDFEHGNGNSSNDLLFRWIAFWYQAPDAQFEVINALQENGNTDNAGGPAHRNIFLVALITALIVGGGGGLLVKMARKRAEKAS